MNITDGFSISSLVIFGGVASAILTNVKIQRDFNKKNPYLVIAFLYILGTVLILLYGCSGNEGKFGANILYQDAYITFLGAGYTVILLGTIVLLFTSIFHIRDNLRESKNVVYTR